MSTTVNAETVLQPELRLAVHFHGDSFVQTQDPPEHIPVQISVRVDDRRSGLLPTVNIHAILRDRPASNESLNPAVFPFLPLPRDFEPSDASKWRWLAESIQRHLLANSHLSASHPQCYLLMRELFWMAFVAAFPTFPHGNWALWDSRIPMKGHFISHWVLHVSDHLNDTDDSQDMLATVQRVIWAEFVTTVEKKLSIPATC